MRKLLAVALCLGIVEPFVLSSSAAEAKPNPKRAAKVKAKVQKYQAQNKRVTVGLPDGTEIKGSLLTVNDEDFVVVSRKTGEQQRFRYDEVAWVGGPGLHWAVKLGIGVGVVFAALLSATAIALRGA